MARRLHGRMTWPPSRMPSHVIPILSHILHAQASSVKVPRPGQMLHQMVREDDRHHPGSMFGLQLRTCFNYYISTHAATDMCTQPFEGLSTTAVSVTDFRIGTLTCEIGTWVETCSVKCYVLYHSYKHAVHVYACIPLDVCVYVYMYYIEPMSFCIILSQAAVLKAPLLSSLIISRSMF